MARTHLLKGRFSSLVCMAAILISEYCPWAVRGMSQSSKQASRNRGIHLFRSRRQLPIFPFCTPGFEPKAGFGRHLSEEHDGPVHPLPGVSRRTFSSPCRAEPETQLASHQRVEHDTTKLVYRYARKQNTPFTYVELFFSDDSRKPLLFRITAGPEGAAIVDTILKKYGPPQEFEWGQREGRTLFWEKGRDVFAVSSFRNHLDDLEYLFCIYFVDNLEEMLRVEEARRLAEKGRIRKAGKSAF